LGCKLAVLREKYRREERQELWRIYMATTAHALGAERSYLDIVDDYEYSQQSEKSKQEEIEKARGMAFDVIARLEKARGGV
jgi:endo-alpha-1,4-polygalactosaminidase (GH114 family)